MITEVPVRRFSVDSDPTQVFPDYSNGLPDELMDEIMADIIADTYFGSDDENDSSEAPIPA